MVGVKYSEDVEARITGYPLRNPLARRISIMSWNNHVSDEWKSNYEKIIRINTLVMACSIKPFNPKWDYGTTLLGFSYVGTFG